MAQPMKPVAPLTNARMRRSSTFCRELHGDDRPEPDLPLLDALAGLDDLVEPVGFRHDANLAVRGERERLVQVLRTLQARREERFPCLSKFPNSMRWTSRPRRSPSLSTG